MTLRPPAPLDRTHDLSEFSSGVPTLDDWLRRQALANQESGATRTFVVCAGDSKVVAYYALASGGVAAIQAPGRFRRNMPDPIPVAILARLAIDVSCQRQGSAGHLSRTPRAGSCMRPARSAFVAFLSTPSRSRRGRSTRLSDSVHRRLIP